MRVGIHLAALAVGALAWTGAAAQGYRLIAGDRVEVTIAATEQTIETLVDADGQVRLAGVGGITVSGLTLDGAEDRLEAAMRDGELYVDPRVSLMLLDYAPVVVAGDVSAPGRYEYFPGMTVAAALALSGGSAQAGVNRLDVLRAEANAEADRREANLEIARTVAALARVRARLAGDDVALTLGDDLRAEVPEPAVVDLDAMVAAEAAQLAAERAGSATLLEFWEREIETITGQSRNFDARITVQEEIAQSLGDALERAQSLQERGLQTGAQVSSAEEREATARSRILELETAKLTAERAIADARRARVTHLAQIEQAALADRARLEAELRALRVRYARHVHLLSLLSDGAVDMLAAPEIADVRFAILGPREGRARLTGVAPAAPLLPGETLLVTARDAEP
ncbi:polysaccharide biosynthesis/export family protein [Roseivivax isoporae]|uniref:Polysaccharide export protein N-terminal domain-containing protein n=1 Tax=Roseivivax isoporae LMG 25204 TaxID=1449351 RepID=X7F581_9RHOB|nr:polysaccharide biosynthesis/export family protein [Roseivivax isoporae]ETX27229.1 hypothetical protein RISW2_15015 [Roseivivax isoporae LMG 25204]